MLLPAYDWGGARGGDMCDEACSLAWHPHRRSICRPAACLMLGAHALRVWGLGERFRSASQLSSRCRFGHAVEWSAPYMQSIPYKLRCGQAESLHSRTTDCCSQVCQQPARCKMRTEDSPVNRFEGFDCPIDHTRDPFVA